MDGRASEASLRLACAQSPVSPARSMTQGAHAGLLLQSCRYQGLLGLAEGTALEDSSVPKLEHPARRCLRFDSARFSAIVNATNQDDDLAYCDPVVGFRTHDLPRIGKVADV